MPFKEVFLTLLLLSSSAITDISFIVGFLLISLLLTLLLDLDKAFIYYSKSIESPLKERSAFGYYNLAEYYYKNKDDKKYKEYMEMYNKLKTP